MASPSSRQRYRRFVEDYATGRLDARTDAQPGTVQPAPSDDGARRSGWRRLRPEGKRREYLRDYLRWLGPLRGALALVFVLALVRAGLEMVEPLFMRYIVDRVLLDRTLDTAHRLTRLHVAGLTFLVVIVVSSLV
ncbi:MAG TPA: hypothetical protein VGF17_16190, partial [Phytomonospora sp.]